MPSGEVITRLSVPVIATAQNRPSSGAQQTESHWLSAALVLAVHVMPSGEVITRLPVPVSATAQNRPSSGDQQTPRQLLSAALVLTVQLIPSGDVITRLPVPVSATAQNRPSSGDQQTPRQLLSAALVWRLHCPAKLSLSERIRRIAPALSRIKAIEGHCLLSIKSPPMRQQRIQRLSEYMPRATQSDQKAFAVRSRKPYPRQR